MNTLNKKTLAMIALAVGAASVASSASACDLSDGGFVAALVECVAPPLAPVARAADQANGALGRPFDHAVAAAANGLVPGSGTAMEAAWAVQHSGMLNGRGSPQPIMPQQQPVGMPMPMPTAMPQLGNFCHTPIGRFGPGPVNQIGAPCHIMTFHGPVMGNVGQ